MRPNRIAATLLLSTALLAAAQTPTPQDPAALVNPFIGTANGGNVFPGATAPFGMVQFSPEASPVNPRRPIAAPGGYEDRATQLRGFSLTNVEGWGCAGGSGDIPLMPTTDPITTSPSTDFRHAYASNFRHADELASPGSYQVTLASGVHVSLAAGTRIAAGTFTFPAGKPAQILVRTSDSEVGSTAAHTDLDPATSTVTGQVTSGNFCGYIGTEDRRPYYTLYFVAKFDHPVTAHGAWHDTTLTPDSKAADGGTGFGPKGFPETGHGSGVYLAFPTTPGAPTPIRLRVGISYDSLANAQANLAAESRTATTYEQEAGMRTALPGTPAPARLNLWRNPHPADRLHHRSLPRPPNPHHLQRHHRRLPGHGHGVHRLAPGQTAQYANFSGWDVYRSEFQLLTWLYPALGSDIAQSLLNQSQQDGGRWDRWTHLSGATHVMNGDPAAPAIADIVGTMGRRC